jgi:hypothetical protein
MIDVTTTIENDAFDAFGLGSFSYQRSELFALLALCELAELALELLRTSGHLEKGLIILVVDDLNDHVRQSATHGKTWALRSTLNGLANAFVTGDTGLDLFLQCQPWCTLLTGLLALLTAYLFAFVLNALAFVWLRTTELTDFSSSLTDFLFIDTFTTILS